MEDRETRSSVADEANVADVVDVANVANVARRLLRRKPLTSSVSVSLRVVSPPIYSADDVSFLFSFLAIESVSHFSSFSKESSTNNRGTPGRHLGLTTGNHLRE